MQNTLDIYRASRDDLLVQITQVLSNDERFVAAWLTGSFSRNEQDALSDLDLTLVVSDSYAETLCRRDEQISPKTTPERLDLLSQFGVPAVIHENNYNAPDGGTFTFTLYAKSRLMVDWVLLPQSKALRPAQAYVLFEESNIPIAPLAEAENPTDAVKTASERVAFFWMMLAVISKYWVRQDGVFVTQWLEALTEMVADIERLLAGKAWAYKRGSYSVLEPTHAGQKQAIYTLGEKMESLLPKLAQMGGQVSESPLAEIKALLDLTN